MAARLDLCTVLTMCLFSSARHSAARGWTASVQIVRCVELNELRRWMYETYKSLVSITVYTVDARSEQFPEFTSLP
jgi:hypothetical protein